jgi:hypothetical protein
VLERLDSLFREIDGEALALFGALALVFEGERFVGAAKELDVVEAGLLEGLAQALGLFGREALVLEFDAVDLDPEDEE